MKRVEEKLLRLVLGRDAVGRLKKTAQENVLDNSMWSNIIDGALKGLETVAIMSLDWKLTGIVKLLQSWLQDKREEKAKREQETLYGTGYQSPTQETPYDPWSSTYY